MSVRYDRLPQANKPGEPTNYRSLPRGLFTRRQRGVNQIGDAARSALESAERVRQVRNGSA